MARGSHSYFYEVIPVDTTTVPGGVQDEDELTGVVLDITNSVKRAMEKSRKISG